MAGQLGSNQTASAASTSGRGSSAASSPPPTPERRAVPGQGCPQLADRLRGPLRCGYPVTDLSSFRSTFLGTCQHVPQLVHFVLQGGRDRLAIC